MATAQSWTEVAAQRANQAWALHTTYIPMTRGFVYLTAVVDWASRKVLSHRVAITLEAVRAVEALEEAFARYGLPDIVNTDQGSQFTASSRRARSPTRCWAGHPAVDERQGKLAR